MQLSIETLTSGPCGASSVPEYVARIKGLWASVLLQALRDLQLPVRKSTTSLSVAEINARRVREEAYHWFTRPYHVNATDTMCTCSLCLCEIVGLDHETVVDHVKRVVAGERSLRREHLNRTTKIGSRAAKKLLVRRCETSGVTT